jgi:hypothetical protein
MCRLETLDLSNSDILCNAEVAANWLCGLCPAHAMLWWKLEPEDDTTTVYALWCSIELLAKQMHKTRRKGRELSARIEVLKKRNKRLLKRNEELLEEISELEEA